MKIAFVIYNGMTALDFIGFYDPVTRLRDIEWDVCALSEEVHDNNGLCFVPQKFHRILEIMICCLCQGGVWFQKTDQQ